MDSTEKTGKKHSKSTLNEISAENRKQKKKKTVRQHENATKFKRKYFNKSCPLHNYTFRT